MTTHTARKYLRSITSLDSEESTTYAEESSTLFSDQHRFNSHAGATTISSYPFGDDGLQPRTPFLSPEQYKSKSLKSVLEEKRLNRLVSGCPGTGVILKRASTIASQNTSFYSAKHVDKPTWRSPRTWCNLWCDLRAIKELLFSSFINIFLITVPIAFAGQFFKWPGWVQFAVNFCAIIPLALMLGDVTEDLALRFGEVIGGLINATFGNVVELTISLVSLSHGLFEVIQLSLLGSILSNMLLVLGTCFFLGGIYYRQQRFSQTVNKVQTSLLFLSCIALIIPDTIRALQEDPDTILAENMRNLSRIIAILLFLMYICFMVFQLGTHRFLFSDLSHVKNEETQAQRAEEPEEPEEPALSIGAALIILTIISVLVAFISEYLIAALEELTKTQSVSQKFLSIILLPIAGNASEHLTAVFVAAKNKMDLSVGIAIGSSIQIAMFVLPVIVLFGWAIGKDLTLEFDGFGVLALTFSVIHTSFVAGDGVSNWLMGLELIATFLIIAIAFWFL